MTKIDIINLKGEKVKELKINEKIFDIEVNEVVLKKAIDLQFSSLRQGTHKTKTRSEVSGGGRKPYKQKGTGRARQGSIRSPQFRGGGIVFGVTPRNYTFKMNKKEKVLAIKSALSLKSKNKEIIVVDSLELASPKTKDLINLLNDLKITGKILFITNSDAENLYLAARNLNNIGVILANEINVLDLIHSTQVVIEETALEYIEEVLKA